MIIIEEVFQSIDEESRTVMLENILVNIIQNTKSWEEPNTSINFEHSIKKNI